MKGGKLCIVIGVACLMVFCGASGVFAQTVVGLIADPPELDFGVVYIGDSVSDTVTVTNTGSIVSIVDILINLNWAGAYSVVSQPTLPYPLGPGESMNVMVQYTPPDFSFHRAELNVVPDVGDSLIVVLWGAGDFPPGCEPDEIECGGVCVDPSIDPNNCGDCDIVCPTPENGVAVCEAGECGILCNDDYTDCDGVCLDTSSDKLNCGGCGVVCLDPPGGTSYCQDGECVTDCGDLTPCGGTCVDTDADVNNCGVCENTCTAPENGTALCSSGTCDFECNPGYVRQGDACVPETIDPRVMLEDLIDSYLAFLADGSIEGVGDNDMATSMHALFLYRLFYQALQEYDRDRIERVCFRLSNAYLRCDGLPSPHDFIEGFGTEAFSDMILAVMATFECPDMP